MDSDGLRYVAELQMMHGLRGPLVGWPDTRKAFGAGLFKS